MSDSSPDLPEVEAQDPEPVAVAIETARALFRTGEKLDALRWLRRAAERAEESGDDLRAVHLARSAADLSTELQSIQPPPPTSRRHDEAIGLSPYDDFSDKTVVDAAAPVVREALQSGVHITELPLSQGPRSVTMPSPSSSEPTVTNAHFTPAVEVVKPGMRPAFRVAVTLDPKNPGTWLVRPLSADGAVPPGCEEALLIALDPASKLLS